jgi:arginine exporter protein ArgO
VSNRNNTLVFSGTLLLLACIGAVTYLVSSGRDVEVALSFMGPIVLAVLASTYNASKLDRVETKVDQAVEQTNGSLDARIHSAVQQALTTAGNPPLTGPGSADDYAKDH